MQPASEFDRDTALTPLGQGRYATDIPAGWIVGGGINGGFQLALAAKAIAAELPGKPDPISISAFYTSACVAGSAEVRVEVKRDGGRLAVAAAELWQGGELRLTTLAQFGDLDAINATAWGAEFRTAVELELPPRDQCVSNKLSPPAFRAAVPFIERFDMLFHPEQIGWITGHPARSGEISGWFRLTDRDPDPISLLQALDALPPVTFDLGMPGWAPTLELTCHVRRRPAPGWLKVSHRTRVLEGGLFEEDCEIWDEAGFLVAQSRQLARQPRPM